jgi:hypothetical protein
MNNKNIEALAISMERLSIVAMDDGLISNEQQAQIAIHLSKIWELSLTEPRIPVITSEPSNMGNTNTTTTTKENMNIEEALATIVEHITAQVKDAMNDAITEAINDYDPTDHYNFEDSVRASVSGMSITLSGEID